LNDSTSELQFQCDVIDVHKELGQRTDPLGTPDNTVK